MTDTIDRELLDSVIRIAREAGRTTLEVYESDFQVDAKSDDSPITEADRRANDVIKAGLAEIEPRLPQLSEESRQAPWEERRHWSRLWLIDPLDGTKEFVNRNGQFTVNIAMIEGHRPRLGVVHVPVTGVTYSGIVGQGAWKQTGDGPAESITVRRLGDGPVKVVASRSHRGPDLDGYLERLGPHETVALGSSLKFCILAEGGADVYPRLGPTSEWDTAAAQAVLEAAGGSVVDTHGQPLGYNKGSSVLNGWFIAYADASRDWTAYLP
ncbi:MAG: 3'(2'),5'-bisphosphate nucleotidase CysQ [Gammaproteobacteria bacterium]